jgi:hypothetical protein
MVTGVVEERLAVADDMVAVSHRRSQPVEECVLQRRS